MVRWEASRDEIARFFEVARPHLNELQRQDGVGRRDGRGARTGSKIALAECSGMSRNAVIKAEREVSEGIEPSDRQRASGGGDLKSEDKQPGLIEALDELVHPRREATRCRTCVGRPSRRGNWSPRWCARASRSQMTPSGGSSSPSALRSPLQAKGGQHPGIDGRGRVMSRYIKEPTRHRVRVPANRERALG